MPSPLYDLGFKNSSEACGFLLTSSFKREAISFNVVTLLSPLNVSSYAFSASLIFGAGGFSSTVGFSERPWATARLSL